MSIWYEVQIKSVTNYLVEVDDNEDAENEAVDAAISEVGDWDEAAAVRVSEEQLEQYKRNTDSDKILPL